VQPSRKDPHPGLIPLAERLAEPPEVVVHQPRFSISGHDAFSAPGVWVDFRPPRERAELWRDFRRARERWAQAARVPLPDRVEEPGRRTRQ